MIILLGETAEAGEIAAGLKIRGLVFERTQSWTEKACPQTPSVILDASHPSSSGKFATLSQWCEQRGISFLRLERPETKIPASPLIFPVYSWEDALLQLKQSVENLSQKKGRRVTIFVTTGSHQLESVVLSPFASSARVVVRILPQGHLVEKCRDMGIHPRDIVAMQGPFSKEINRGLFKFYRADILLTLDSGLAGGTDTKISAALELGLEIVLVKKTKASTGLTANNVGELLNWVDDNIPNMR